MRSPLKAWKSLKSEQKDYLFIYTSGMLWALTYLIFTPPSTSSFLLNQIFITFWLITTVIGSILAIYGLLINDNLLLERLGVTLILATPVVYTLLQLSITVVTGLFPEDASSPWFARINLIFLGLWLLAFHNKRRRQLKDKVREAKATPLPGEIEENGDQS